MRTYFQLLSGRSVHFVLACLSILFLMSAHPGIREDNTLAQTHVVSDNDLDGTQLAQEAKQLLAETFNIPVASVTAVYCCQLLDGRYKYNCSIPINNTGFVYFTLSGGQIIEDDLEGF